MPRASPGLTSFNAGEFSRFLDGRVDLDKYAAACKTLNNFLPRVQGPAQKRSGLRFVRGAKFNAKRAELIPFIFSNIQAYMLEFGDTYMRVYKDGGNVLEGALTISSLTNASPVKITTSTNHGYVTGDEVFVAGTGKVGLDNRYWPVVVIDADEFTLTGSSAPGSTGSTGTVARVYQISTPYTESQVGRIAFTQSADVLYLAHPDVPPQKLTRTGHTSWTLTEIAFDFVPFSPENIVESDFVAASAGSGTITLTSNRALFNSNMVGSYVKLRELLELFNAPWKASTNKSVWDGDSYSAFQFTSPGDFVAGDRAFNQGKVYEVTSGHGLNPNGVNPPIHDSGYASDGAWDWKFINFGFGYAKITEFTDAYRVTATVVKEIPRSTVSADKSLASFDTANPMQIQTSANHGWETGDKIFFRGISGTRGTALNNQLFTITRTDTDKFTVPVNGAGLTGSGGIALRMDVGTNANGNAAIYPSLWRWSLSAFSGDAGYPQAVTFFEDRLIWAATARNPQTLWFSRTSRYEDHRTTDDDDSAMVATLNSAQVNVIAWLAAQSVFQIGTTGAEWATPESNDPLTPDNLSARIKQRSSYGSIEGVPPVVIENVVIFAQTAGHKLRERVAQTETDPSTSEAPDLTLLAQHITSGVIRKLAFQSEPTRVLWVILQDGSLRGLTYERAQNVSGWHRHSVGGTDAAVESIAVIPHPDGDRDQLWAIVRRTIHGGTKRYVEKLEPEWQEGSGLAGAFFLDSGITYDGSPATVLRGLEHLEGESVSVLADGVSVGMATVSSGAITLASAASVVQVGLPYLAELETMRIEAGAGDGTAQSDTKRTNSVCLRLYQTGKGLFAAPSLRSMDAGVRTAEVSRLEDGTELSSSLLFDGDTRPFPWPGGYEQAGRLALRHTTPLPCTITGIYPTLVNQDR